MGAGWRPVPESATGGASYGPFPTAAHAVDIDVMDGRLLVITRDWGK